MVCVCSFCFSPMCVWVVLQSVQKPENNSRSYAVANGRHNKISQTSISVFFYTKNKINLTASYSVMLTLKVLYIL